MNEITSRDPSKPSCNAILDKMVKLLEVEKSNYKQTGEREEAKIAETLYMDYKRKLMVYF